MLGVELGVDVDFDNGDSISFADTRPTLHSRLRYAAFQAYTVAFRLRKNCRRLQSPVQFLRNSANARQASQPISEICSRRN